MDAVYGLSQARRQREDFDFVALLRLRQWQRVAEHQLLQRRLLDALHGRAGEYAVRRCRVDRVGATLVQGAYGLCQRARGIDLVIYDERRAPGDLADDGDDL